MSKRALKNYVSELSKKQLEAQLLDLYERFNEVKVFYDFVFNPKEEKLIDTCKAKITKEYFPVNGRKPKTRRSIAQKEIKHFIKIGVEARLIADVMLYNIEIAQTFSKEKKPKQEAFYKSMHKSFDEALIFIITNNLLEEYKIRIVAIFKTVERNEWYNLYAFEKTLDKI